MLLQDFYTINKLDLSQKDGITAIIELNKNHEIYQGHFPGNPVVPGVCLTQLIKEIMERVENTELKLTYANNIKFMAVVNPEINNQLQIDIKRKYDSENKLIKVNSTTHFNDKVFYKFKGNFQNQ